MKIVQSSFEIITPKTLKEGQQILRLIEQAGRTCYKSENKITNDSAIAFVTMLRNKNHHAMLEFGNMIVKFIIPRHLSHELVRHRLCSFAQESTRFCDYKDKDIQVIKPISLGESSNCAEDIWKDVVEHCETAYQQLRNRGVKAQIARAVLPLCLKTEIICSANLREWRHIFQLRTSITAHPDIRDIMIQLLGKVKNLIPVIFDDIGE